MHVKVTLLSALNLLNMHCQCIYYKAVYLAKTFNFKSRGGYINVAMTKA